MPAISAQIIEKKAHIQALEDTRDDAKLIIKQFQKQLDEAEAKLSECLVAERMNPCTETEVATSDCRAARDAILMERQQALSDAEVIPQAVEGIRAEIKALNQAKKEAQQDAIRKHFTEAKVAKIEKNAIKALGELGACRAMLADLPPSGIDPLNLMRYATKDKGLMVSLIENYKRVEKTLGLDEI